MLVALLLAASSTAAQQPARVAPAPAAPPHLLNIVMVKLKRGAAGSYGALEGTMARAYERARVKVYWVGLQASKDTNEVLYLKLSDAPESADGVAAIDRESLKQHPEIVKLQQRLSELEASETAMLTTRRDDVDPPGGRPDFATMRAVRLTVFQVRPGREGDFITAIRTTGARERGWLVYEANESSTFALITPLRLSRSDRNDGPPVPRTLRRFKGVYMKADTRTYSVRPALSHVPQSFVAANPQFWRPAPTGLH
jgi:hypothetical protein